MINRYLILLLGCIIGGCKVSGDFYSYNAAIEKPANVRQLMLTDYGYHAIPDLDTFINLEILMIWPISAELTSSPTLSWTVYPPLSVLQGLDSVYIYPPVLDTLNTFTISKSVKKMSLVGYELEINELLKSLENSQIDTVFCSECVYDSTLVFPFEVVTNSAVSEDTSVNYRPKEAKTFSIQLQDTYFVFPSRKERRRFRRQTGL